MAKKPYGNRKVKARWRTGAGDGCKNMRSATAPAACKRGLVVNSIIVRHRPTPPQSSIALVTSLTLFRSRQSTSRSRRQTQRCYNDGHSHPAILYSQLCLHSSQQIQFDKDRERMFKDHIRPPIGPRLSLHARIKDDALQPLRRRISA
eukprot:4372137-Pleurochrysis_carterae.AAC.1